MRKIWGRGGNLPKFWSVGVSRWLKIDRQNAWFHKVGYEGWKIQLHSTLMMQVGLQKKDTFRTLLNLKKPQSSWTCFQEPLEATLEAELQRGWLLDEWGSLSSTWHGPGWPEGGVRGCSSLGTRGQAWAVNGVNNLVELKGGWGFD